MKRDNKKRLFEVMGKVDSNFINQEYLQETPKPNRLDSITRKKINRELSKLPSYLSTIPIEEIDNMLNRYGLLLLQEDNTPYEGIFTGEEGKADIALGLLNTVTKVNGLDSYTPIENSMLIITWYKMGNGKYEIVSYLS